MNEDVLCKAVQSRCLVRFNYAGDLVPGERIVEPHMVAYNRAGHLALSAWFLGGASQSGTGPGWREYLLSEISHPELVQEHFSGPRPGYRSDGGKSFHSVVCAL